MRTDLGTTNERLEALTVLGLVVGVVLALVAGVLIVKAMR